MSLIAHWPLNGHGRDIVGGRDAYDVGGSGLRWSGSPTGGGVHMQTDDDHIYIPHDDQINNLIFGKATTFSISFFYYPVEFTDYGAIIQKAERGYWSNVTTGIWAIHSGIEFILGCNVVGNPTGGDIRVSSNLPLNEWSHVSCIADGNNIYIYVNGELIDETPISGLTHERTQNEEPITIGPRYKNHISKVRGILSDLKLYDHALSRREMSDNSLGVISHWTLGRQSEDGVISGYSVNDKSKLTLYNGCKIVDNLPGIITSAAEFDSSSASNIELPTQDFKDNYEWGAVSMWAKLSKIGGDQCLFGSNINRDRQLLIDGNGDLLVYLVTGSDVTPILNNTGYRLVSDKWYHIVFSWGLPNGLLHVIVNGETIYTGDVSNWTSIINGTHAKLGCSIYNDKYLNGYIAHFKTYGQPINANQARSMYLKRISMTNVGSHVIENIDTRGDSKSIYEGGLLPYDYVAYLPLRYEIYDTGPYGLYHESTSPPELTDRGYHFDGVDNYVEVMSGDEAKSILGNGKDNITILLSVNSTTTSGTGGNRIITRDASDHWALLIDQNSEYPQNLRIYSKTDVIINEKCIDEGWNRVVFILDGNNSKFNIYVNSTLIAEGAYVSSVESDRGILLGGNIESYINNGNGNDFKGLMEDLHIVKGVISKEHIQADYKRFTNRGKSLSIDEFGTNTYQLIEE